jgi:type VII secretion-associated serine protease mycosin
VTRGSRLAALSAVLLTTLAVPAVAAADTTRNEQWYLGFLDVAAAQQISQGEGVVVAVVDTGVDANHVDLAGNVLPGVDLFDPAGNGQHDRDGHGTAMAGLIAAHGNRDGGILGIAPKAKILPITAGSQRLPAGAQGIMWAAEHGAKVICYAIASPDLPDLADAVRDAIAHDVVLVAGVGNRPKFDHVVPPAAFEGVVAAAGVDRNGEHAQVSVTGPEVVLAAPSDDIVSTDRGGGYRHGTGTSDSTAIIAGAAALVRAKYPNLSAKEVIHRLTATAIDKGKPGRDDEYGYGIVNLVGALTADVPPPTSSASPAPSTSAKPPATEHSAALIAAIIVLLLGAAAVGAGVVYYRRGRVRP